MRRIIAAAVAAGLLVTLATATGAGAGQAAEEGCVIPRQTDAKDRPADERARSENAKAAVGNKIEKDFGRFGPGNPTGQLERGYIGGVVDGDDQVILVVDPKRVEPQQLQAEASGAADDARAKDPTNVAPITVTVQGGCFSADELLDALKVLLARDWHPRADEVALLYFLDPHDSTFHVTIPKEDRDVAEALKERLGDRVTLSEGRAMDAEAAGSDRVGDRGTSTPAPAKKHYGGSELTAGGSLPDSDPHCTSAFAVTMGPTFPVEAVRGQRGMITAGHCYDDLGGSSGSVHSGFEKYGQPLGESGSTLPLANDGTTLTNQGAITGQLYTNRIYTNSRQDMTDNPDITMRGPFNTIQAKDVRDVVSTYTIPLLTAPQVCYSGMVSGNVCNANVSVLPVVYCPALDPDFTDEGCVIGARTTQQPSNYQTTSDGDSGGPVYVCVTNSTDTTPNGQTTTTTNSACSSNSDKVSATGVITGNISLVQGSGIFDPVSDLAPALGVTILTSP